MPAIAIRTLYDEQMYSICKMGVNAAKALERDQLINNCSSMSCSHVRPNVSMRDIELAMKRYGLKRCERREL